LPARGRFNYVPPTYESNQRIKADNKTGQFDSIYKAGFEVFKPKLGSNHIRLLPNTWQEGGHYYALDIWVHSWIGAEKGNYLCLRKMKGKPCPLCLAAQEALDGNDEETNKALRVGHRKIMWILDRASTTPEVPKLHLIYPKSDQEILLQMEDDASGKVLWVTNWDRGYDLTFVRDGVGLQTRYIGWKFAFSPSPALANTEKLDKLVAFIEENTLPSILNYYPAEHMQNALSLTGPVEDEAPSPVVTTGRTRITTMTPVSSGRVRMSSPPTGRVRVNGPPMARRFPLSTTEDDDIPF